MLEGIHKTFANGGLIPIGGVKHSKVRSHFIGSTIVSLPKQTAIAMQDTFVPILYILEYEKLE
jgi:acyl-CoA reductase-like NAD-dependent aldehyde dehydrogenase